MSTGFAWLLSGLTAISLLMNIANMIWVWRSSGGAALDKRLGAIEAKLITHDRRVQTIEGELKHLPTREDLHKLDRSLTELTTELKGHGRDLGQVERAVDRIERHLMGEKA
ncbi:MAG: DUF2730 family protein [Pseudomonadota bacterium]